MLAGLIKVALKSFRRKSLVDKKSLFDECDRLVGDGKARQALKLYEEYRQKNPYDTDALNNLACICDELGLKDKSAEYFLLAYQLDDRNLPVVLNYIRFNYEHCNIAEAKEALRNLMLDGIPAKFYLLYVAGIYFRLGSAAHASEAALEAWLNNFDKQSYANNYLMYSTYSECEESRITAEHIFWAGTLPPVELKTSDLNFSDFQLNEKGGRIRIAYWSPDFRNHSVRYFIRTVIENHNKANFQVICYHDIFKWDEQTEAICDVAEHFFQVNELSDSSLVNLMRYHQLDILVELAGHTSANRLYLLAERLAKIQITGFGYPPTTGLKSVDFKILDSYVAQPASSSLMYSENILSLDSSFWCFEPKTKVPISFSQPMRQNGFVTFGCFGNVAKISDEILAAWAEIFEVVSDSQLIIRSIFFEDESTIAEMKRKISRFNISLSRVKLLPPLGVDELFNSYNDVDIILDTFPFSGGTTTCFATYMGVPVLTLVGQSLISRMGGSVMRSLGMEGWICNGIEEYIEKAICYSKDPSSLEAFRFKARERYDASPIGNGRLFVDELEQSYIKALEGKVGFSTAPKPKISEQELIRRARRVMASGDYNAALRILNYCLAEYPGSGVAVVMLSWRFVENRDFEKALNALVNQIESATSGVSDLYIQALRVAVYSGDHAYYRTMLKKFKLNIDSPFDFKDVFLQELVDISPESTSYIEGVSPESTSAVVAYRILVIVLGDPTSVDNVLPDSPHLKVEYLRVNYRDRLSFYREIEGVGVFDFIAIVRAGYKINNLDFSALIKRVFLSVDILGFSGAKSWCRFDWLNGPIGTKEACVWLPTELRSGVYEVNLYTDNFNELVSGMAVLDGGFLIMKPKSFDKFRWVDWAFEYGGEDFLFEQYACNRLASSGYNLGVCKTLGLSAGPQFGFNLERENEADMKHFVAKELNFNEVFPKSDYSCIAFPFDSVDRGVLQLIKVVRSNE